MNINAPTLSFVCGTTINPSTFVKVSTAADYRALPCVLNDEPIGVAQEHERKAPVSGATTEAGNAGDPISVYGVQETCYLVLGSTVTRGDLLMPDNNAKGITATTGKYYGAVALESGVADEKIRVNVLIGLLA